jgi:hypothetical protein
MIYVGRAHNMFSVRLRMWMVILVGYLIMIIVMRTFIWDEKHMSIMVMRYMMIPSTKHRCDV